MTRFDAATLQYHLQPTLWNRFQEHVLRVWTNYTDNLKPFFDFLKQTESTGKFKFTNSLWIWVFRSQNVI